MTISQMRNTRPKAFYPNGCETTSTELNLNMKEILSNKLHHAPADQDLRESAIKPQAITLQIGFNPHVIRKNIHRDTIYSPHPRSFFKM